jgi:hypothetical protein
MQNQPMRALITKERDQALHDVPAMIPIAPQVGAPLQMFLDSGKVMRTSEVKRVTQQGSEVVVDTLNSTYHLKPSHDDAVDRHQHP